MIMRKKPDQKTLKRWHEKHSYWVHEKNCTVCGSTFYTLFTNQAVCDKKDCQKKEKGWHLCQK